VRPELAVGEEIRGSLHGGNYNRPPNARLKEKPALSCSYVFISVLAAHKEICTRLVSEIIYSEKEFLTPVLPVLSAQES
jgi:hypothetical protein